jgi:hypothetical protein
MMAGDRFRYCRDRHREATGMSGEFDAAQLKLLFIDVFGTPISVRDSCYGACAGNLRTHCGAAHVDIAGPSGRPLKSATLRGIRDFNVSLLEQRKGDGRPRAQSYA